MAQEIYSSARQQEPLGQLRSSEFARVVMASQVTLGQSVAMQYSRPVRSVMAIGMADVLMLPGVGQGSMNVGRMLGTEGLFGLLNSGVGECGQVAALQISVGGGRCVAAPTDSINFGGGMVESIGIQLAAQQPEIVESYGIRFSTLQKLSAARN